MIYGSGDFTYELVDRWAKLPEGWSFRDIGGIATDRKDNVYVLNRSPHPVMVFDKNGKFLSSWGEGQFTRPHGTYIARDGTIYCTDDGNHTVTQFTPEGRLLKALGTKDKPSDTGYVQQADLAKSLASITHGGGPFNRPTGVAQSSSNEIFVSDGYGNARVHRFSPDGKLILSWGQPGTGPGQFNLPPNVTLDKQDRVWVPDRENNRIQIFDIKGKFLNQWMGLLKPTDIKIDDEKGIVYVSELGLRVSIFTLDGKLLSRWKSEEKNPQTDLFVAPHAIAVDSRGDIYIGEVSMTHSKVDKGSKTIQKFARKK